MYPPKTCFNKDPPEKHSCRTVETSSRLKSLVIFGQIIEILATVIRITQIVCKPLKGDAQLLIFDDGSDTCDWNVEFCLNFKGWVLFHDFQIFNIPLHTLKRL